jgi:pimeloyl-ACP methyl ester carboxylesterase
MPTVLSEGVRLAVDVHGHGDPVTVVGHGLTGGRADLAVLAPFIPGTKILFDFRGHGDSERPPPGSYSMDLFAADVDAVVTGYGATRLVGISLGGGATLRLLHTRPDRFERLVFVLPARLEEEEPARARLLRLADLLETRPLPEVADVVVAEEEAEGSFDGQPAARDLRMRSLLAMNSDGIPHAIREALDDPPLRDPDALRGVTAPALVVGQEGDPVHRVEVARELAEVLPSAELVVYPDRFALLREIPSLTRRIADFLAG